MEIVGYIASILIGISLGMIGSGGSILTVPVLFYLFDIDPVLATAYSLFIVGVTSAIGSFSYLKNGQVNLKTAAIFGTPAIIAVYATRAYIVPKIPTLLFTIGNFNLSRSTFLLVLFALLMVVASFSMIRKNKSNCKDADPVQKFNYPLILVEGTLVGILTGLVGAGGGFLIIPALVILSKLPMKQAIGTSLVIIAAKSLIGFSGEDDLTLINWTMLLSITGFAVTGIFLGAFFSKKIDSEKLRPIFGYFVLIMGLYIILNETILKI